MRYLLIAALACVSVCKTELSHLEREQQDLTVETETNKPTMDQLADKLSKRQYQNPITANINVNDPKIPILSTMEYITKRNKQTTNKYHVNERSVGDSDPMANIKNKFAVDTQHANVDKHKQINMQQADGQNYAKPRLQSTNPQNLRRESSYSSNKRDRRAAKEYPFDANDPKLLANIDFIFGPRSAMINDSKEEYKRVNVKPNDQRSLYDPEVQANVEKTLGQRYSEDSTVHDVNNPRLELDVKKYRRSNVDGSDADVGSPSLNAMILSHFGPEIRTPVQDDTNEHPESHSENQGYRFLGRSIVQEKFNNFHGSKPKSKEVLTSSLPPTTMIDGADQSRTTLMNESTSKPAEESSTDRTKYLDKNNTSSTTSTSPSPVELHYSTSTPKEENNKNDSQSNRAKIFVYLATCLFLFLNM